MATPLDWINPPSAANYQSPGAREGLTKCLNRRNEFVQWRWQLAHRTGRWPERSLHTKDRFSPPWRYVRGGGSRFRQPGGTGLHARKNLGRNFSCVFALKEGAMDVQENRGTEGMTKLRVGLLCGGPSQERGISLNSARSVLDHLQGADIAISCYYLDPDLQVYGISTSQMYSNTPSDFDYKLSSTAQGFKSLEHFLQHLQASVDIVFPVLHGKYGEDGGIQGLLESGGIPYVGTSAAAAKSAFDKATAAEELGRLGFATLPSFLQKGPKADLAALAEWFDANDIDRHSGRVVVKPARAGSSVGVSIATGVATAAERAEALVAEGVDDRIVVELFAEGGKEFTAIVLDAGIGDASDPVTLLPTEVELRVTEDAGPDSNGAIFDYRKKYLPTRQVLYHNPPRFSKDAIAEIRSGAATLFRKLGLRDFARVDGWLFPSPSSINLNSHGEKGAGTLHGTFDGGTVVFSDINLMSGMEQTSFLFQQAAQVGLSHMGVLRSILGHACSRFPQLPSLSVRGNTDQFSVTSTKATERKKKVFILFGGNSSERQVSLISGTNIWLNLRAFNDMEVTPFLLTPCLPGRADAQTESRRIWALPYSLVLRHTVEEIVEGCVEASKPATVAAISELRSQVLAELKRATMADQLVQLDSDIEAPKELTLKDWIEEAKEKSALVFIAVHGDIGENGVLQELLEEAGVAHTGSGSEASRLCMDKAATGQALGTLLDSGVLVAQKRILNVKKLFENDLQFGDAKALQDGTFDSEQVWDMLREELQASSVCVKPLSDGCSTGVARLCCPKDLEVYLKAVLHREQRIPPGRLSEAHGIIELPDTLPGKLLLETFIETDDVRISSGQNAIAGALGERTSGANLFWKGRSRWLEVTVGVVGRKGEMYAFNPSITVKESGAILSLEEKFQGGTGVNLTPPPPSLTRAEAIEKCRDRIALVANTLGIEGFARIDAFLHVDTGEVIIIEANTVPGMTPSTVLIHQALAEEPPIYPKAFFRMVVDLAFERYCC